MAIIFNKDQIDMDATEVVQFGTSRFLQAHADLFFSECKTPLSVTVVHSSGNPARAARLSALASPNGYPVRVRGIQNGNVINDQRQITSIKYALSTEKDWDAVCRAAATARFILSNTSDSGFDPTDADLNEVPTQAMSYPAKLAHILAYRFALNMDPPTLLPTELLPRNGDRLKARVVEIAKQTVPLEGYLDWLQKMPAANSLVDRIVSEPIEPAGAITEPYALWAIEKAPGIERPCIHPAITLVPDLEKIERLKLHILNLGHTYLAEQWILEGRPEGVTVLDAMTSSKRDELANLLKQEVIPGFANHKMGSAATDYVATTLERFSNPFLAHLISDISQNHTQKVQRRINAFLEWSGFDAAKDAPRLTQISERNSG